MIFENLPYANLHDINLDWILKQVQRAIKSSENLDDIDTKLETATNAINNTAQAATADIKETAENATAEINERVIEITNLKNQAAASATAAENSKNQAAAIMAQVPEHQIIIVNGQKAAGSALHIADSKISANHRLVNFFMDNPEAEPATWTVSISTGALDVNTTFLGSTNIIFILAIPN